MTSVQRSYSRTIARELQRYAVWLQWVLVWRQCVHTTKVAQSVSESTEPRRIRIAVEPGQVFSNCGPLGDLVHIG